MDMKAIGKRVRAARRARDMTQEQLAELVEISTSFVGHIERGTRVPSLETMWRICKAMGLHMDNIMG